MPCYRPKLIPNKTKSNKILAQEVQIMVPCGKCIGCLRNRAQEWCQRMWHESQEHLYTGGSGMITLTYTDESVPHGGDGVETLQKSHLQRFFKRLRYRTDKPIKYYAVGEYGRRTGRPHYHIALFGEAFTSDRVLIECSYNSSRINRLRQGVNQMLYSSKILNECWTENNTLLGIATTSDINTAGMLYIGKYLIKTWNDYADEIINRGKRIPAFATMSNGIGRKYYEKHHKQWYDQDCVRVGKMTKKPSRYYDKIMEKEEYDKFLKVKLMRKEKMALEREKIDGRKNEAEATCLETRHKLKGRL